MPHDYSNHGPDFSSFYSRSSPSPSLAQSLSLSSSSSPSSSSMMMMIMRIFAVFLYPDCVIFCCFSFIFVAVVTRGSVFTLKFCVFTILLQHLQLFFIFYNCSSSFTIVLHLLQSSLFLGLSVFLAKKPPSGRRRSRLCRTHIHRIEKIRRIDDPTDLLKDEMTQFWFNEKLNHLSKP